jgi:hypothetical protein
MMRYISPSLKWGSIRLPIPSKKNLALAKILVFLLVILLLLLLLLLLFYFGKKKR